MDITPNYYAIIPANVRYDENLNANEKLLFGEITALTQSTGICWASNNYFANLYKKTPQAISKWIKNLEKNNYIFIDYKYKKGTKMIERRNIKLVSTMIDTVSTDISIGINNGLNGYQQGIKDNNTSINNTSINNTSNDNIKQTDKYDYKSVIDYLNEKADTNFKNVSGHQSFIKARYNEGYTLDDFKYVIDVKVDEWKNSDKYSIYLRPKTLFGTKFDDYLNQKKVNNGTTRNYTLDGIGTNF